MNAANERQVSQAFSKQSGIFDTLNEQNGISVYLRSMFRARVDKYLPAGSRLLEINCGTGLDAIYFASKGHQVLATDNSPGMLEKLTEKSAARGLGSLRTKLCSYHQLRELGENGFDHILSNFGGLNCTDDLDDVLRQLAPLLKSNGMVTLMIMPKVCPWEIVQVLRGKFRTAFRRFRRKTPAHIEGVHFFCYYYNPSYVIRALKSEFDLTELQGVCVMVPPEFYSGFAERYPRLFKFLSRVDETISHYFPFTYCCDHYLITLRKR